MNIVREKIQWHIVLQVVTIVYPSFHLTENKTLLSTLQKAELFGLKVIMGFSKSLCILRPFC